jgi:nucleotide-binding universal stress UspA family protein
MEEEMTADPPEVDGEHAVHRIVVGIDGSDSSKSALTWAAQQSKLTGQPLQVIITWEMPTTYGWAAPLPEGFDLEGDAREAASAEVAEVLGAEAATLDLTVDVIEGHPATVLLHESEDAALLVVGSRGHGAFAGMLLGSVGQHLAGHAACPVVIMRDGTAAGG